MLELMEQLIHYYKCRLNSLTKHIGNWLWWDTSKSPLRGKTRWPFTLFSDGCQPISLLWRCWWHLNIFCPVLQTSCGILLEGLLSSTLTKVDFFNNMPSFPVSSSEHWMPFLQLAETSHSTWVALVLSLGLWFACGTCPFITVYSTQAHCDFLHHSFKSCLSTEYSVKNFCVARPLHIGQYV